MNLPVEIRSASEKETKQAADEFSKLLTQGDTVAFNGDLGTGKTFFIKQICSNFGIENVTSPTFSIVNEYDGKYKVYHFDFYRLNKVNELFDIGFEDYMKDETAVKFIEWAELMEDVIPVKRFEINIGYIDADIRLIKIDKHEK